MFILMEIDLSFSSINILHFISFDAKKLERNVCYRRTKRLLCTILLIVILLYYVNISTGILMD